MNRGRSIKQSKELGSSAKRSHTMKTNIRQRMSALSLSSQSNGSSSMAKLAAHAPYLQCNSAEDAAKIKKDEALTAPLFSAAVYDTTLPEGIKQYGLLAAEVHAEPSSNQDSSSESNTASSESSKSGKACDSGSSDSSESGLTDNRIFLNVAAPWSAFICGSQGSGKSHTLSCILEACLMPSVLGELPSPLSSVVFHYDKFTSHGSSQLCEAAYLCSAGIPVKVLVSPTNFHAMEKEYENLPGLPANSQKPQIIPLEFMDKHLNIGRIKKLMAVDESDGTVPLYIEIINKILRQMAEESQGTASFSWQSFRRRLDSEDLSPGQKGPLNLRISLIESFLHASSKSKLPFPSRAKAKKTSTSTGTNPLSFASGTLTIVDLSCPFVDSSSACALFNICQGIYLEQRQPSTGLVIALDEAHKFLTASAAAAEFTEDLLDVIRQQRHLGARVVVATQEPTVSEKLLDLASFSVVHRFSSPAWFKVLRGHLAGVVKGATNDSDDKGEVGGVNGVFEEIVALGTGEALLFAPSAALGVDGQGMPKRLGDRRLKMRVRKRITADGGRSVMAGGEENEQDDDDDE